MIRSIAEWASTAVLAMFAFAMVAQPYVIPTGSMENNLLIGDRVLVDKLAYAPAGRLTGRLLPYGEVRRGDMIVFNFPLDPGQPYVKRAIGIAGDRIRIVNKQVWVNGAPLAEPYKVHKTAWLEPYRDNFPAAPFGPVAERGLAMLREHVREGELIVPPGHYFALGDNRDNSLDSRYWGFVPRENIIGKPVMVVWSFDAASGSWLRWQRTFKRVSAWRLD